MNFFKNLSITTQIVSLSIVLLILLGIVSIFSFKESDSLIQKSNSALLENLMLDSRNNETKFFVTRNLYYADSVKSIINETFTLVNNFDESELKTKLYNSVQSYYKNFNLGVETIKLRGLNEDTGAEGDLRKSVHKIEDIVKSVNNKSIMVEMLMARRSEKDFFMRTHDKYIDKVKNSVNNIKEITLTSELPKNTKSEISALADRYLENFIYATDLIKRQSINARIIDNNLAEIEPLINALIMNQTNKASFNQNVKLYGIILSVLVGLGLSIFISRLITQPIINLQHMAKEISTGNYDVSLEVEYNNEIGKLTNYLNEMTTQIRTSQNQLQQEKNSVELRIKKAIEEAEKQNIYLSNSVEKILAEMEKFSEGDLTVHLKISTKDKIAELYNGFNYSVEHIQNILKDVKNSVKITAEAGKNILHHSDNISSGILHQTEKINELASSIDQITLTINDTTKNTIAASNTAQNAGRLAETGGEAVKETLNGMKKIANVVQATSIKIKQLGESGEEISDIIEVINNIADQTNLLALNAAIEAARAGNHGRGFGVVADEVRKLAEQTSKATKEISVMIKKIQYATKEAVVEIELGNVEVIKGLDLAQNSGETLSQIIKATLEVEDIIHNVASSSEEQAQASENIRNNINLIREVSQTSARGINEILEDSHELKVSMENLTHSINKFKINKETYKFAKEQTYLN